MKGLYASIFVVAILHPDVSAAQRPAASIKAPAYGRKCGLPGTKPESVGFSSERLERLDHVFQDLINNKQLAGAVLLLARNGKLAECKALGYQDLESAKPMQLDSIFRLASMTKPIMAVAMMILYEEGKWKPTDPISQYLPELANLKAFVGTDGNDSMIMEAPKHSPTVGELMTHTAGFTYGFFGGSPVEDQYRDVNPLGSSSSTEFTEKLSKLPLLYQPGERWVYSLSVDIQGVLVERLSGMTLADFLREKIFDPLRMTDTDFFVPVQKQSRLTTVYGVDTSGSMEPIPREPLNTKEPGFTSGGGGLYSTPQDYLRFAQMLLNGGELDGVRILAPSSVLLIRTNHLPDRLMSGQYGVGYFLAQPGLGYGYDVAVYTEPLKLGLSVGKGTFYWDGAAGTWFWVDPTNYVVFIGMIQRSVKVPPGIDVETLSRVLAKLPDPQALSRTLTYQALVGDISRHIRPGSQEKRAPELRGD